MGLSGIGGATATGKCCGIVLAVIEMLHGLILRVAA